MTEKHQHIWVLDASFGDVIRIEIPANFPENGDYEKLIEEAFENDGNGRRLTDCNWMIGSWDYERIYVSQEYVRIKNCNLESYSVAAVPADRLADDINRPRPETHKSFGNNDLRRFLKKIKNN